MADSDDSDSDSLPGGAADEEPIAAEELRAVPGTSYVSKDGKEQWVTTPTTPRQARQQNIIKGIPGPTAFAKQRIGDDSPVLDSFLVQFTPRMFELIASCTNIEASRKVEDWTNVTIEEMHAFIGLLILRGVYKATGENTEELWSADGRAVFGQTMSYNRFRLIRRFLRFDDKSTRQTRSRTDKCAAISKVKQRLL